MASVNRDIAKILGRTEAANTDNVALGSGSGLTVYATPDLLPTSGLTAGDQAFVTSNNRIYISNGSGWYNVALINSTPTFTTGPDAAYALATDLTPTVITLVAQDSDGQSVTYSATPSGMDGIATLSQDSSVFTVTPLTDSAGGAGSFTITFQATDGIGIASEVSTFTLSFGPNYTSATESKIVSSDLASGDAFGISVSMSSDGSYAIVGAWQEDTGGSNAGAAYIFTRSGSTWTQQAKITASDAQADDAFGYSVSISSDGSYAIVGAWKEDTGGSNAGAAYVYVRSGSTWTQQAKLTASDAQADDQFGISVSISGDGMYAIVGARFEDGGAGDPLSNAGAAYVYVRSGSSWPQQAKLIPSNVGAVYMFGWAVSINSDGTYAIVSASNDGGAGAAYIFVRSGSTWTEQQKLVSSDLQAGDDFGMSVSISGDGSYVVVGARDEDGGAGNPISGAGAAYIFTRSGSSWTEQGILRASDAQANDSFGYSVSISSDASYAIVGAYLEDGGAGDPNVSSGAAYVFTRSGSTWTEQARLTASDPGFNDFFGNSVSMSSDGSYAIVGAYGDDGIFDAGAAYIYKAG